MSVEHEPVEKSASLAAQEPDEETKQLAKGLTKSEKIRNYLIGIGALTGLVLGLVAQFKGEPVAEKTWTTLSNAVNDQAKTINKIRARLVYFQAWQEAKTAMDIQQKLEDLQAKYDKLLSKQAAASMPSGVKAAARACPSGQVLGDDGACHKVKKTVAARMFRDEQRLAAERAKRIQLERSKMTLLKRLLITTTKKEAMPQQLKALPAKLEDVRKR